MRKFLAVLILIAIPLCVWAAVIFDESFESGFGVFTEGENNDPSTVFVASDATAPDGTHDVEFVFEAGMSDGEAPGHINGPISGNPSEIYSRFYFKLSSGFQWHDYEQKLVFYWADGIAGAGNFYISIGTWTDHKMFGCIQGDGTTYRNASGPNIQTGRWYKVDVHLAASGGVFQLWLDDALILNFSGVPLGSGGWWRMALRPIYGGYYPGTAGDVPQTQYLWMDRAIVSTTAIGGGPAPPPPPGDTTPPAVSGLSPAANATNVATTNRTIVAHVTDAGGVAQSTIRMAVGKNGGAKTEYTGSALTISGTSTDYTVTRTMTADWSAGDVVNVTIYASDTAGNVMSPYSYSYYIISPSGGPYAQSPLISAVSWEFVSKYQTASGSDQWPMTWAADNNVYAWFDDGGGFGGSNTVCRAILGMSYITGTPPSISGSNVYGCKADGSGCDAGATHDAGCDAPYASSNLGYGEDIFALDNTLYGIVTMPTATRRGYLVTSTDFGQTWTQSTWYWNGVAGGFRPDGFLQAGQGYAAYVAPSGGTDMVYIIGGKYGDYNNTYLARAPKTQIMTQSAWTYFYAYGVQPGDAPSWTSSFSSARPIHTDSNGGNGGHLVYIPGIKRYVLTQAHGAADAPEVQKFAMYESTFPWGPWYTIAYYSTWGNYGTGLALWYSIVPKWISDDGTTFWMSFSAGTIDSLNLIRGTFTLATQPQPPPGISVGSYFYGPYLYGTLR